MHLLINISRFFALIVLTLSLYSCSHVAEEAAADENQYSYKDIEKWDKKKPDYVNPFTPGTYRHFIARPDYPQTYDAWQDAELLKKANGRNSKIIVEIATQRGKMMVDNQMVLNFPISTGVSSFPTKTGNYQIISRHSDHKSNLYGTIYDAEGKAVKYDADMTVDAIPEGGRFEGSAMPYFMRLTNAGLGLHVGKVRRRPCSHGCIRTPREVCKTIFEKVTVGTPVDVVP